MSKRKKANTTTPGEPTPPHDHPMNRATAIAVATLPDISANIHFDGISIRCEESTTYEQWLAALIGSAKASTVSSWIIGDLLNFGEQKFKKDYKTAIALTGLENGTLRNMASVAKRFGPEERRSAVSFAHHRIMAGVKNPDKVKEIMDRVETEGLSVNATREIVPKTKKPKAKKLTAEQKTAKDIKESAKAREALDAALEYLSDCPPERLAAWFDLLTKAAEFDWPHYLSMSAAEVDKAKAIDPVSEPK